MSDGPTPETNTELHTVVRIPEGTFVANPHSVAEAPVVPLPPELPIPDSETSPQQWQNPTGNSTH